MTDADQDEVVPARRRLGYNGLVRSPVADTIREVATHP